MVKMLLYFFLFSSRLISEQPQKFQSEFLVTNCSVTRLLLRTSARRAREMTHISQGVCPDVIISCVQNMK